MIYHAIINKQTNNQKDGQRHGEGKMIYNDGSKYEGQWVHGKRNGQGILYQENCSQIYEGEFQNDMFHGYGTIYYSEECNAVNHRYQFFQVLPKRNLIESEGVSSYNQPKQIFNDEYLDFNTLSVQKFSGSFIQGIIQGEGMLVFSNQLKYKGYFSHGVVCGQGTFLNSSNQILKQGYWNNAGILIPNNIKSNYLI